MATILHLSDIHRTEDEPVSNDELIHALIADLDQHGQEGLPAPDLLVVSGDFAQSAQVHEYDEAERFVSRVLGRLGLGRDRVIVVPGNHDVHWPTSEGAFRLKTSKPPDLHGDLVIPFHGEFLCANTEAEYQSRLDNFRHFYQRVTGSP